VPGMVFNRGGGTFTNSRDVVFRDSSDGRSATRTDGRLD
jgi:hypothetical protein